MTGVMASWGFLSSFSALPTDIKVKLTYLPMALHMFEYKFVFIIHPNFIILCV